MSAPVLITESAIRALATPDVFTRGWKYFEEEAIETPTRQGGLLQARCYGSGSALYQVRAEVDENGIGAYTCTCPYTWGGACKHVVALLLCYLHQPGVFTERLEISDMLVGLTHEDLVGVISRLVERQSDLYQRVERVVHQVRPDLHRRQSPGKAAQPESEKIYQRRVYNILHSLDHLSSSQAYWDMTRLMDDLESVKDEALDYLANDEPQSGLTILMVLLEEVGSEFEALDDSDGIVGDFLEGLAEPLAQAALQASLPAAGRRKLANRMEQAAQLLASNGIDGLLELPRAVRKGELLDLDNDDEGEEI